MVSLQGEYLQLQGRIYYTPANLGFATTTLLLQLQKTCDSLAVKNQTLQRQIFAAAKEQTRGFDATFDFYSWKKNGCYKVFFCFVRLLK